MRFTFRCRIHSQNTKANSNKSKQFCSAIYVVCRLFSSSFGMFSSWLVGCFSGIFFFFVHILVGRIFFCRRRHRPVLLQCGRIMCFSDAWHNINLIPKHLLLILFTAETTHSISFLFPATDKEIIISFSMQIFDVIFCARIRRNKKQIFNFTPYSQSTIFSVRF